MSSLRPLAFKHSTGRLISQRMLLQIWDTQFRINALGSKLASLSIIFKLFTLIEVVTEVSRYKFYFSYKKTGLLGSNVIFVFQFNFYYKFKYV